MKKLLQSFKNLKFRYKLTLLVLAAGLIPVSIIVVYMQCGMMNLLRHLQNTGLVSRKEARRIAARLRAETGADVIYSP